MQASRLFDITVQCEQHHHLAVSVLIRYEIEEYHDAASLVIQYDNAVRDSQCSVMQTQHVISKGYSAQSWQGNCH